MALLKCQVTKFTFSPTALGRYFDKFDAAMTRESNFTFTGSTSLGAEYIKELSGNSNPLGKELSRKKISMTY